MNVVMLTGRLCADAETRTTQSGKTLSKFRIAVYDGKDAQGNTKAQFINCKAWNCDLSTQLTKGTMVKLSGKIEVQKTDNGYYTEVVINDFDGLAIVPIAQNNGGQQYNNGGHQSNNGYGRQNNGGYQNNNGYQNNYRGGMNGPEDFSDDNVPF